VEEIAASVMGIGHWEGELVHTRQDGSNLIVSSRWALQHDAEGQHLGFLEVNTDITRRKEAEDALKESEKRLRYLSSKMLMAQDSERKTVAQDVHDSFGASLAAVAMKAEMIRNRLGPRLKKRLSPSFDELLTTIRSNLMEVRRIQMDLHPSVLDDLGIIATIQWFCRDFAATCTGIHLEQRIEVDEADVPYSIKRVVYRILQESLNNVGTHSGADMVHVLLGKPDGRLELRVSDNGQGFNLEQGHSAGAERTGLGLVAMQERAELSGGSFSIKSHPGEGTTVIARWPGLS
jgi:signal transduction histidine kinase